MMIALSDVCAAVPQSTLPVPTRLHFKGLDSSLPGGAVGLAGITMKTPMSTQRI